MTAAEVSTQNSDPAPEPDSIDTGGSAPESWLERVKAAVGMRGPATMREEIVDALASEDAAAGFSPEERAMIANILRLREVRVDDVMVPRADIDSVEIGISLAGLLAAFQESGHSRMPVYRETLDDPVGLVHIKDLMGYVTRTAAINRSPAEAEAEADAGEAAVVRGGDPSAAFDLPLVDLNRSLADADLVRNILFVPPSMPVTALLATMQGTRMQMALVIDEYGGTDGLVSLEDIVEMVVGDIEDEHDDEAQVMIVSDGDGVFLADARADLEDVEAAIGADLAPGEEGEDVDTIGGLVFSLLGRIPVRGELVSAPGGFEFEILDADPRRIKRLRIYRQRTGATRPEPRRRPRVSPPEEEAGD